MGPNDEIHGNPTFFHIFCRLEGKIKDSKTSSEILQTPDSPVEHHWFLSHKVLGKKVWQIFMNKIPASLAGVETTDGEILEHGNCFWSIECLQLWWHLIGSNREMCHIHTEYIYIYIFYIRICTSIVSTIFLHICKHHTHYLHYIIICLHSMHIFFNTFTYVFLEHRGIHPSLGPKVSTCPCPCVSSVSPRAFWTGENPW